MSAWLGDIPAGATLPVFFCSYDADGASVTLSGLAVTDIEIYKGASITQRSSDAGYALVDTDGIDVDGITGLHAFSVDLSDDTDSGFFAVGSYYTIVVSAVTIDGQAVTFIPGRFRIVAAEHTAGYPVVTIKDGTGTGEINTNGGKVVGVEMVDTLTTYTGNTPQTGDAFARLGAPAGASVSADVAAVKAQTAAIETDTAEIGAAGAGLTVLATQASVNTIDDFLDTEIAAILAAVDTEIGAIITAIADVPTNAELATALAAADDAVLTAIGNLNDISPAEVNAEVVDALATDTYAEPGQGTPAATASLATKVGFLYKAWRNRTTQDASEYALYADDATTKDQEAPVSDDGTTFDRGEVRTGA